MITPAPAGRLQEREAGEFFQWYSNLMYFFYFTGLSGAMASISVRSGSPTHPAQPLSRRRNGLHDVDLNTFIAEEMALHLDPTANRKRGPTPCSDVIIDSPTHKRNRMLWTLPTQVVPPDLSLVANWTAEDWCHGQPIKSSFFSSLLWCYK